MTNLSEKHTFLKIYAELNQNFNGYYQQPYELTNLLDGKTYSLLINNQFLSVRQKFTQGNLKIGYWSIETKILQSCLGVTQTSFMGSFAGSEKIDFFLPQDLFDVFPTLIEKIGYPSRYYEGILTPSGRSIWVFGAGLDPICLKIDTFNLDEIKNFNYRRLELHHAEHSLAASNFLKAETNIFQEDAALSIQFDAGAVPSKQTHYTYLVRSLDCKKVQVQPGKDFLVPMYVLVSKEFWQNQNLLQLLGLHKINPKDFFANEIAQGFAQLIRNSLDKSYLHFELHQQNISVHFRQGRFVKLIYHDLLDTVFDSVSYFLKTLTENKVSIDSLKSAYGEVRQMQKKSFFNAHGDLQKKNSKFFAFTVTSLYRRYLRNFGDYTKIYNVYSGDDYLNARKFEAFVLKNLNFTDAELGISDETNENNIDFLRHELFWCIDRYHEVKQGRMLKNVFDQLCSLSETQNSTNGIDLLKQKLDSSFVSCSDAIPFDLEMIDFAKISQLQFLFENRMALGLYGNRPFLLLFFNPE